MMKAFTRKLVLPLFAGFVFLGFLLCAISIHSSGSILNFHSVSDTRPWRSNLTNLDEMMKHMLVTKTPTSTVDLRIIVIVFNRAESMLRLLTSLNEALYFGDRVVVDIWIDRSKKNGEIHEETYKTAFNFSFRHGTCRVHNQTLHVGIYGQWLRTWFPSGNSSEIAVILEDDLTVSPHFYQWLKLVHKKYDGYKKINGFSLQGVSIKHSGDGGLLGAPLEHQVFLYPIIGTWGFSPSETNWIDFLEWFNVASKNSSFQPLVPGIVPTDWYKTFLRLGRTDGMWSMWHIYFSWMNSEVTLYPNYPEHCGFTTNWKEAGLHYSAAESRIKSSDKLVLEWKAEYEWLPETPVCLDVKGHITSSTNMYK